MWMKTKMKPKTTMAQLYCVPNDIMVEILARLPVNYLLRLRWTCKYLFNLITKDSSFIKMHLLHHSPTYLCVLFKDDNGDLFKRYFNYNTCKPSPKVRLDFRTSFTMLSSCNGLIFFQSYDGGLCIWNPCTKEYKVLPNPPTLIKSSGVTYGFGYDRTIDDYKVIRNVYVKDNETNVQVYTLGTNSWRSVGSIPNNICSGRLQQVGMFVNGALCWLVKERGVIISFDIETEKYKVIPKQPLVFKQTTNEHVLKLYLFFVKLGGVFEHELLRPLLGAIYGQLCVMDKEKGSIQEIFTDSLVSLNSGTYAVTGTTDRRKKMQLQSSLTVTTDDQRKKMKVPSRRKTFYKILYYRSGGGKYTDGGDGWPEVGSKRKRL